MSYHVSLKGSIKTMDLLDIIEGVQKGKKKAIKKLNEYAKKGYIRTELYNKLIAECGTKKEKSKTKIVCIILCIVLLLVLVSAALVSVSVVYHNKAIDDAYVDGKDIGYYNGYNKGYGYYKHIKDEYEFFHEHAVITTTTGKKYHRYDCYHIRNRSFYIYNIENAESKGYTPCRDCYPTVDDIIKKYDSISKKALEKVNKEFGIQQD